MDKLVRIPPMKINHISNINCLFFHKLSKLIEISIIPRSCVKIELVNITHIDI